MSLKEYAVECHAIANSKGWWDEDRSIPELLCLIHSEVSEALEGYRNNNLRNFEEEIADVLIRVFDMAEHLHIDLDKVVTMKMEINRNREYRHGGKRI
jgi:NTP pyrophosphatase (non-canonical NTP hydrolase)